MDHGQHRADAVGGAVRPLAIDAFQAANRETAGTNLREQALLSGVAPVARVRQGVDDALRSEIRRATSGGVVTGASRRWPRLEVLADWVTLRVHEGLSENGRAHRLPINVDDRAVGAMLKARNLRDDGDRQRIKNANNDG
jgi:hypothetical protein